MAGREKERTMRKVFEIGGLVAAAVLIAFGVASIAMSVNGRTTVQDSLKLEQITGSADMTPAGIKAEASKAGLTNVALPSCSIAGKLVDSGAGARCFASYMRIHALEASGGLTYSQMPRFATADGKGTNDVTAALQANGRPVDNAARNLWVTETALTTALNTSYLAEQISLFGIVVGIALLLSGIGFGVLSLAGALRGRERLPKPDRVAQPVIAS
jgi:F0F1-type ATP synthase membrane subunit c/vacuolar-type H+-ATPase subunit K